MAHKLSAPVKRFAINWARNPQLYTHAEFCRKFQVNGNTAYRMLASSLAEHIKDND